MGIHREYMRLTPSELARARCDPEWLDAMIEELSDASFDQTPPARARFFSVDTSWAGIDFVLGATGGPCGLINGTEALPTLDERDYGPPRCLTPEQVTTAVEALTGRPFAERVASVDARVARTSNLYDVDKWDSNDVSYITVNGEQLIEFFTGAADAGDAVVAILT